MKPYYSDSHCTIFHGDCREILPSLPKADLVLTDPPYGIDYNRNEKHKGNVNNPKVYGDDKPFEPNWLLAMKIPMVLWGGNCYASKLPDYPAWLCWKKTLTNGAESQSADFELAWSNALTRNRIFEYLWAGCYRAGEREGFYHPTQKPIALMQWCLTFFPQVKNVADPYMGTGPVLIASKLAGIKSVGIEIVERYAEIAANRLRQSVLNFEG